MAPTLDELRAALVPRDRYNEWRDIECYLPEWSVGSIFRISHAGTTCYYRIVAPLERDGYVGRQFPCSWPSTPDTVQLIGRSIKGQPETFELAPAGSVRLEPYGAAVTA